MRKELELWLFTFDRLNRGENVMLLIVAESSGSSPGRAGYKMAVAADGKLCGSIGGGVMEVKLVEQSRQRLSVPPAVAGGALLAEQVHQKNSPDASGMICSGRQTVIVKPLSPADANQVRAAIHFLKVGEQQMMILTRTSFGIGLPECQSSKHSFEQRPDNDFAYCEMLALLDALYIVGGGHCSLALSEVMSKLDFRISIFDDRTDLSTIEKNDFADNVIIIEDYAAVADSIPDEDGSYVVVMTLGYASDKVVIKQLCNRDFKYFGVLGSKAKMATLMNELKGEGIDSDRLARIRTPIGIPINSRTPEEIAVSIAAEIIAVKNGA